MKTVPWDKVDIEVLLIELIHAGSLFKGSREEIHQFLSSKSYVYLGSICMIFACLFRRFIINNIFISAIDDVFVRKDLLKTKYDFVDYISAEKYSNWLQPLLQVHCRGTSRPESYVFQQSNSIRFSKKCS